MSHAKVIGVSKGEYEEALKLTKMQCISTTELILQKIPKSGKKRI